jgi:hypothetical protein
MQQIETALTAFLQAASGQPVVNERNPGPAPSKTAYVCFFLFMQTGTMWPVKSYVDPSSTLTETVADPTEFKCNFTARGAGAQSTLNKIRLLLRSDNRYKDLWQIMGLGGCGDVQNTATRFEGRILEQATMEITLHAVLSVSEVVDYFTSAEVDVEGDAELVLTIP